MNRSEKPDISIIIVNYNVKEFLANSLQSVRKASKEIDTEIFVVDNNSSDGSMEFLKPLFPEVHFIENDENLGFGKANNQAIKLAKGAYTLLLNPDTVIQEDTLQVLMDHMEKNPETGACGCKILNPDGSFAPESRRTVPTVSSAIHKAVGLTALFPKSKIFGKYYMGWKDEDEPGEIPVLSGSFMFFRTEVLKEVDGFDERFFMYGEDIDLCYRVAKKGWKIDYVPSTSIIHYKGESTKKDFRAYNRVFNNALYQFFDKHYTSRYSSLFRFIVFWAIQLRALLTYITSKVSFLKYVIIDLLVLNGSLAAGYFFRFWFEDAAMLAPENLRFLWLNLLLTVLYLIFAQTFGVLKKNRLSIVSSLKAVTLSFIMLATITFFIRDLAFSRIILGVAGILSFVGVGLIRFIRINRNKKIGVVQGKVAPVRALIAGVGNKTESFITKLNGRANWQVQVAGVIHQSGKIEQGRQLSESVIGSVNQLEELVKSTRADTVIFLMDYVSHTELLNSIKSLRNTDADIKVVPGEMNFMLGKAEVDYLDDMPLVDLDLNYYNPVQKLAKRIFDFSLSLFLVLLLSPFSFFLPFKRDSMVSIPVYDGNNYKSLNLLETKSRIDVWCNRLLASWGVLTGRVSFAGSDVYPQKDAGNGNKRFKTGLTGYSQINSERISSISEEEKFDLYYLQNYSVWLDLDILFKAFLRDESITGRLVSRAKS